MRRSRTANLIGLAVLSLLKEKPMHPYEIATLMKQRGLAYSIKLNFGSLYSTIAGLLVEGKVAVQGTEREGNLPERTVYRITELGEAELETTLRSLLGTPDKEYPRFAAGLSFLAHLPPQDVVALFQQRAKAIEAVMTRDRAVQAESMGQGVNELFLLEMGYSVAVLQAEYDWVVATIPRLLDTFSQESAEGRVWRFASEAPMM